MRKPRTEFQFDSNELAFAYIQDYCERVTVICEYEPGYVGLDPVEILNEKEESVMDLYDLHGDFKKEVNLWISRQEKTFNYPEEEEERYVEDNGSDD